MTQPQSKFRLKEVKTQHSTFKNSDSHGGTFDIKLEVNGILNDAEQVFTLNLFVNITGNDSSFEAAIHQVGVFEFESDTQERELSDYFLVSAPALIFPYVRSYISALTALSGFQTITIPALNMTNLREQLRENITKV